MRDSSDENIKLRRALDAYHELINRYRTILTDGREPGGDPEATIVLLVELLDGPDWRIAADLRRDALGLAVPDEEALIRALRRMSR